MKTAKAPCLRFNGNSFTLAPVQGDLTNKMAEQSESVRKPVLILLLLLMLACAGTAAYYFTHHRHGKSEEMAGELQNHESTPPAPTSEPVSVPPVPVSDPKPIVQPPAPAPPPPATYTDKIVSALLQLNMTNGPLTPEK